MKGQDNIKDESAMSWLIEEIESRMATAKEGLVDIKHYRDTLTADQHKHACELLVDAHRYAYALSNRCFGLSELVSEATKKHKDKSSDQPEDKESNHA